MSEIMKVQPFDILLKWMLRELEENESIFGIHRSLFYSPQQGAAYATEDMFGHYLATPIGPAAGPHTQLSQNIISAWLSGGRFIELKTVQIMDESEIPRPCIDMEDEGYNVEWSQELKLDESAHEYINAWALIHILRRVLGFEEAVLFGTIFNMSIGYDLKGVQSPPMQRFMERMADASAELAEILVKNLKHYDALVPIIGGKQHPLFAAFQKRIVKEVESCLEEDRLSMVKLFNKLNVCYLEDEDLRVYGINSLERVFYNMNHPDEYETAKRLLEQGE